MRLRLPAALPLAPRTTLVAVLATLSVVAAAAVPNPSAGFVAAGAVAAASDGTPPEVVSITIDTVEEGWFAGIWVVATDADTGGSGVARIDVALDGRPLDVEVRSQDAQTAEGFAFFEDAGPAGEHEVCAAAWDGAGNSQDACTTFEVLEGVGPVVLDLRVSATTLELGEPFRVDAVLDDRPTGRSFVGGGRVLIDGTEVAPLQTGYEGHFEFEDVVEDVWAELPGLDSHGEHTLCLEGYDIPGHVSAEQACVVLDVPAPPAPDTEAPRVTSLRVETETEVAIPGERMIVIAEVDDSATGGSRVASATALVYLPGADPADAIRIPLQTYRFDDVVESVWADTYVPDPLIDEFTLCVVASDELGNAPLMPVADACLLVPVARRSAEGSGRLESRALGSNSDATFSFEVTDVAGAEHGVGELRYADGWIQFEATSVAVVDITGSDAVLMAGTGLLRGAIECTYVFSATERHHQGRDVAHAGIDLDCPGLSGVAALGLRTLPERSLKSGDVDVRGA